MNLKRTWKLLRSVWNVVNSGVVSSSPGGVSSTISVPGLTRPAENVLMVYACLTARREAIGGVPVRITDKNDNPIERGALFNLLQRPNGWMNFSAYIRALETYLTLYNMFAVAKVGGTGDRRTPPDELVPLSPAYLTPELGLHAPTGVTVPVAWLYNDPWSGRQTRYMPDDLILAIGFNPHAPAASLSPLTPLMRTMQQDIASREANLALLQNRATPEIVLQTDNANLTREQAREILASWNESQQGFSRRGQAAVLWGGMKPTVVGLTPAEMEYLAGLKFTRTEYYIAFRVKPGMVGDMIGETGLSQGSAVDQQKVEWWEDVGLAELNLISEAHQSALINAYAWPETPNGADLWFDDNTIPALVRHRLTKMTQLEVLLKWGWKPDDAADFLDLGLPPHPTNEATLPFNVVSVSEGRVEQPLSTGATPVARSGFGSVIPDPSAESGIQSSKIGDLLFRLERALERAADPIRKYQALIQRWNKLRQALEKQSAKKYSRFFLEQRARVLEKVSSLPSDALTRADASGKSKKVLEAIFNPADENAQLLARIGPAIVSSMEAAWNTAMEEMSTGKANPFAIEDPRVMKAIKARQIQATKVNATTEDDLRKIIEKSFEEGATTVQLSDNIAEYYKNNAVGETSARPMTAARTQTAGIVNDGRMLAARSVGKLKKAWLQGSSEEPRPEHTQAMSEYMAHPIDLEEKFIVAGIEMDAPGDPAAPIDQTANCNCMVVFVSQAER